MWILKGTLYGIIAFVVFGLIFYVKKFSIRTNAAISWRTLEYLTIQNQWFWAVFVMMVCTGIVYARWMAEIP